MVLQEFQKELAACGITKVRPHFYLSTEWGVPFDTISIAIPFYLARVDLTDFHAERGGLVEGGGPSDILRYIRHEMGHVINYAYRLYDRRDWAERFGDINQDYEEEYRPRPFHAGYVNHLPGWYAQKHPDEDWAETFAVWMTPGRRWREQYARRPALAKLEYCDRIMGEVAARARPLCVAEDPDEEVGGLDVTLDQYYQAGAPDGGDVPPDLGETLLTIFRGDHNDSSKPQLPATRLYPRAGAHCWPPTYIGGRVGFPSVHGSPVTRNFRTGGST